MKVQNECVFELQHLFSSCRTRGSDFQVAQREFVAKCIFFSVSNCVTGLKMIEFVCPFGPDS